MDSLRSVVDSLGLLLIEFVNNALHLWEVLKYAHGSPPYGCIDGGGSHIHATLAHVSRDARLGAENAVVGYLDMSGYTHLSG